jgi:hypothetical protein
MNALKRLVVFFHGFGATSRDMCGLIRFRTTGGRLDAAHAARRIVGCVVHASLLDAGAQVVVLGPCRPRLIVGEPDWGDTVPRAPRLIAPRKLTAAGFDVRSLVLYPDANIWYKAVGVHDD